MPSPEFIGVYWNFKVFRLNLLKLKKKTTEFYSYFFVILRIFIMNPPPGKVSKLVLKKCQIKVQKIIDQRYYHDRVNMNLKKLKFLRY